MSFHADRTHVISLHAERTHGISLHAEQTFVIAQRVWSLCNKPASVMHVHAEAGETTHRISQISAMSDHISIKHFALGCYEL